MLTPLDDFDLLQYLHDCLRQYKWDNCQCISVLLDRQRIRKSKI